VNKADADFYRCPASRSPLVLEAERALEDEVLEGTLLGPGTRYEIRDGIPDFTYPAELATPDQTTRTVYDSVAPVYDEYIPLTFSTFGCDEREVRNHMVDRLEMRRNSRVLEVGAGTGRTTEIIAERLAEDGGKVYLQDISRGILERAVERFAAASVPHAFFVGNGLHLPFADDSLDAVFHFGGINMFSDVRRGLSEMARVVRPGGRVVVGDESVPPWLRDTEFGQILMNSSAHYKSPLPLEAMPVEARDVVIEYIIGGVFFLISFTVGVGPPTADFDFEIPGARGGTHRTRYAGQLEGVTPEAKALAHRAREKRGVSMHRWLDEVVREAAEKELRTQE
jgi:ubiquinone/menaquinone biosynthesis C-methylase UbiE